MNSVSFNPMLLWAKKNENNNYHPLLYHMLDVAAVVDAFFDSPRMQPVIGRIVEGLKLSNEVKRSYLSFFASIHDLGKAYPHFQFRDHGKDIPGVIADELTKHHLLPISTTNRLKPPKHAFVTAAVVEEAFLSNGLFCSVRMKQVLGGHHGLFPSGGDICKTKRDVRQAEKQKGGLFTWAEIRSQLVGTIKELIFPYDDPKPEIDETDNWTPLLLTGLISVADWIGSNAEFFPYRMDSHFSESYWNEAQDRARHALSILGWLDWRPPAQFCDFRQLFPFVEEPRPLQEALIQRRDELQNNGLVIIEAPMGEGKTEAALYLQDLWCSEHKQAGAYMALPTMAASNQLFVRTKEFLQRRYPQDRINFLLLHSHAVLNDKYQEIRLHGVADDDSDGGLAANDWFCKPKRGFLAPFAVGTIDQALLAVLQVKYGYVRLFGLAGKTLIFDEVHAYDAYMLTLFKRLLEWLARFDTRVVILSATLPSRTRRELLEAYADSGHTNTGAEAAYPRISYASGEGEVRQIPISSSNQSRTVRIEWIRDDRAEIARQLAERLSGGGCAVWICNTVGRAQDTYSELKEWLAGSGIELELFHARYPLQRRFDKEKRVTELYGKDRTKRPAKSLLIATQVVEQSLDLDFDWTISDLAPVDLLLQRSGRMHRHTDQPRPALLAKPTLQIIQPGRHEEGDPDFTDPVYDEYVMMLTWLTILERKNIKIPDDIETLIESVYGVNEVNECNLQSKRIRAARSARDKNLDLMLSSALKRILLKPDDCNLFDLKSLNLLDDDNPNVHSSIAVKTRYSKNPSVSVVFLEDNEYSDLSKNSSMMEKQVREFMKRTITLSYDTVLKDFPEKMIPSSWKKCGLLRYVRAVYVTNGIASLETRTFQLSSELGCQILYTSKGDEDVNFQSDF